MTRPFSPAPKRLAAVTLAAAVAVTGLVGLSNTTANAEPAPMVPKTLLAPGGTDAGMAVQKKSTVSMTKGEQEAFREEAKQIQPAKTVTTMAAGDEATGTPIGGQKNWLGLDDSTGGYFAANYVLRGIGDNIEVWVQANTDFPEGDCRNDDHRTTVTDDQVSGLVSEFDNNILPKESAEFSVAPGRDGTQQRDIGFGAPLWELLGDGNPDYYKGDGEKTVVLVSNVRDANYYNPNTPDGATFILGFFSPAYNEGFDRNVMTIDAYDWLHRTGANPPSETPGGWCSPNQAGLPRAFEGVFAHEYQHLLEYSASPGESIWLNEGLSDYAQTLVGYVDTTIPYGQVGADRHVTCFQGFYGNDGFPWCGAENSLTRWGDQGGPSILSDYGAAYTFVTYVENRFGRAAIKFLHNDAENSGLASLQAYLDGNDIDLEAIDVVHDWAAQMATDRLVDKGAKGLTEEQKARLTASELSSTIDWNWTGSYDSPGAPANGSDYVLARGSEVINGRTIDSVDFYGSSIYTPDPLEWVVDTGALYGGEGDFVDRAAVYKIAVPDGGGELTFDSKYDIEVAWDFGLVQVSTDGGKTYTSLANANTTSDHDPAADGRIVAQLPGLTGLADTWASQSFDLSEYAGQEVMLSFRYMTDAAVNGNGSGNPSGWWVKNVAIGDTVITDGTNVSGALSATQVSPIPVDGWKVQAVGWSLNGKRINYADIKLSNNMANLSSAKLTKMFKGADRISFVVTLDDPLEMATKDATYTLKVNDVIQDGGRGDTIPASDAPAEEPILPVSSRLR